MLDLSVIVPVYNVEKYLEQCLNSILEIKNYSMEIICTEDCSTDNSRAVLEKAADKDDRIKIIYHDKNRGVSAARNSALKQAEGRYILFADPDDYVNAEYFDEIFQTAEKNDTDLLIFNMKIINQINNKVRNLYDKPLINSSHIVSGKKLFSRFIGSCADGYVTSKLWKRSFIEDNELWFREGIIYEDTLYWFYAMMYAERIMFVDKNFYVYRKHREDSLTTSSYTTFNLYSNFIVCLEIFRYWQQNCDDIMLNTNIKQCLAHLIMQYNYIMENNPSIENNLVGDYAEKGLFRLLNSVITKTMHLDNNTIKDLLKKEVLVYGCEEGAEDIIKQLRSNNVKIKAVMVCEPEIYPHSFCGCKVLSVNNNNLKMPVVVTAKKSRRENIVNFLRKKGFTDIIIAEERHIINIDECD